MQDMLHYDEAYDAVDALSLLQSPRFTPFFPGNYGRESGWSYLLTPFIAILGGRAFSLRLAAVMVGTLTLVAEYALAREILGRRGATWATGILAVLYWHVHLSHLALRAILFPPVGALAFAALLRAQRTNALRWWLGSGVGLGLLAYTYFSSYPWILLALLMLVGWLALDPARRHGALLALGAAAVLFLPMVLYTVAHPALVLQRPSTVQAFSLQTLSGNLKSWAGAWFQQGDSNAEFNLPGRPILDLPTGALCLLGLAGLPHFARRRWQVGWTVGWAVASLLPSLLSNQAPHFLRAIGLTLPLSLLAGAGALALERGLRRLARPALAAGVPLLLLLYAGTGTYQDFQQRWLGQSEVFAVMEQHINRAISYLHSAAPEGAPIYFSPFSPTHPVLQFRNADLAPRHIGAIDSHCCQVVPDGPAIYVSLSMFEPDFASQLSRWADLSLLAQDTGGEPSPRYSIYAATPRTGALWPAGAEQVVFADALQLRPLASLPPTVSPGATLNLQLAMKALHPLDRSYSMFVHLYGQPTPYEGGRIWSQGDQQICPSYTTNYWLPDETIIQEFKLSIPADVPPGRYTVAIGIYESPAGSRLPITAPSPMPWDYYAVQEVEVVGSRTRG